MRHDDDEELDQLYRLLGIGYNVILPGQTTNSQHKLTGEQRFALAMIADAVNNYQKSTSSHIKAQELHWLQVDNGAICTFGFCCELLGLDPDLVRERGLFAAKTGVKLPPLRKRTFGSKKRKRWSNRPIYKR